MFEALAAGEITLDLAKAYGATSDQAIQAQVFEQVMSAYYAPNPDSIRRMVLAGTVRGNDPRARLVGRDAYIAAGGRIERELFDDDDSEAWADVALLENLASAKMDERAKALAAEQGLAWVKPTLDPYASSYWMTYSQAQKLGAQVRKGEKSTIAIFYKSYTKEVEAPDTGETSEEARRVLKAYPVFNADQVENLPERFHPAAMLDLVEPEGREQELDAFFGALPAVLRHQGDEAYYEPTADRITMPPAHMFSGFDHYYATLAHELSHWTGHASRLDRDLKNRFGTAAYAAEELIALSGQSAPCLTHH